MSENSRFLPRICLCLCLLLPASRVFAQNSRNSAGNSQQLSPAMKAAIAAARPGPEHAQLMKRAGVYTTTQTFYQAGMPPQQSTGTATLKSILGGRFLEEKNSGSSLGQPYRGLRLYGYNNGSKEYEAIWIYNGSTAFLVLDGTSDDGGKTVRYSGAFIGPTGRRQTLRVIVTQNDPDHFTVKLLGEAPDGTLSTLTTVYSRVNKPAAPR